jgi:hypothetical protein
MVTWKCNIADAKKNTKQYTEEPQNEQWYTMICSNDSIFYPIWSTPDGPVLENNWVQCVGLTFLTIKSWHPSLQK